MDRTSYPVVKAYFIIYKPLLKRIVNKGAFRENSTPLTGGYSKPQFFS